MRRVWDFEFRALGFGFRIEQAHWSEGYSRVGWGNRFENYMASYFTGVIGAAILLEGLRGLT